MVKLSDLNTEEKITWCPGCSNFGILTAMKNAIVELKLEPHNVLVVSGIGCHGHLPNWINTYGFCSLHGRALPVALGAKLANHELNVIVNAGDGDCYGEGMNHFINTARTNVDVNLLVHNNKLYSLTTGQFTPTTEKGLKTRSTPFGVRETPINPLTLAIASGATFVARGYAGDIKHLTWLIVEAIKHKGFSLIDILQPCVALDKVHTFQFYNERVYKLEESEYRPNDRTSAFDKAQEWDEKIPIGIFYKEDRDTYEKQLPQIEKVPLAKQNIENVDISHLLKEFY